MEIYELINRLKNEKSFVEVFNLIPEILRHLESIHSESIESD